MNDKPFGPEYHKIQTVFKRDERNVIIPGDWSLPEFAYLADAPWRWTEKVDGTNIRLHWNGESVVIGGRTDNAQIPAPLVEALRQWTDPALWRATFPDAEDVTLYGEGYGEKIQKGGGNYRKGQGFILFDVKVGPWWLQDEDVSDVARKMAIDTVPLRYVGTLNRAIDLVCDERVASVWPNVAIEGLVGRPTVDLFNRKGNRIIAKVKVKDFRDLRASNARKAKEAAIA